MKSFAVFVSCATVMFLLAACSGSDPTPTSTPVPATPTSTPVPSTPTPTPDAAATLAPTAAPTTVGVFLPNDENLQQLNFWVALGAGLFEDEGLDSEAFERRREARTGGEP